jgi:hypothetical protein
MKRLHFKIKNDLSLLHNELLAEIEELRPVPSKANYALLGDSVIFEPVMHPVEGDADNVWLTVPDNANEKAIQEVVLAHKPS